MNKKFVLNLALLLFVNLLVKPFYIFGIDRGVQNAVGPYEYGIYASLFSFSILLNILLDVGITNFNNKNIAQYNHLLSKYFPNIISFKILLGILYGCVCFTIALLLDYNVYQKKLLIVLAFNQFLLSMVIYLRSNLSGLHLFKIDSFLSVTDRLLLIISTALFLYCPNVFGAISIERFVILQSVSYASTVLVAFVFVIPHLHFTKIRLKPVFILVIFKQSYPYALLILLMSIYTRIDLVMIERMLPEGALVSGIYAQAYRILDALSMFAYLFATLLLPMFAKLIVQKSLTSIRELSGLSFMFLLIPAVTVAITTSFYSKEIMALMYQFKTVESAKVYAVLVFGFIPIATTYIFGTLLTANGSMRMLNQMGFVGIVVNIALNAAFIPSYGAVGAAWASVVTQFATAIIQVLVSIRIFGYPLTNQKAFKFFVLVVWCVVVVYVSPWVAPNWIIAMVIAAFSVGALSLLMKLIDVKAMLAMLKQ